ncbi:hypothetical protein JW935_00845 [candidate division KSB1 bacterium]|nr:hypothetical protein [candidate division KSB1 bacterium]
MVKVEILLKRIQQLDEYLGYLDEFIKYSFDEFISIDRKIVYSVLQENLQDFTDIKKAFAALI